MNRGAIAHFADASGEIDDSGFPKPHYEDGEKLLSSLEVRNPTVLTFDAYTDGESIRWNRGRAAKEHVEDAKSTEIHRDGRIDVGTDGTRVRAEVTDVLHVQDEFIVTQNTECDFAHSLVEDATGGEVVDTRLDLRGFVNDYPDVKYSLGGFYDRDATADKEVNIGHLNKDEHARENIDSAKINRLGIENFSYNGRSLDFLITESGYVDIYDSNVDTTEFVQFLHDIVMPHVSN